MSLPTAQSVTISACNPSGVADQAKFVSVMTPKGTVWNSTMTDMVPPTCPATVSFTFGGLSVPFTPTKTFMSPGWHVRSGTGTAQTGESGAYVISVQHGHVKGGTEEFKVAQGFNAPEFGAPIVAPAATGFAPWR